MSAKARRAAKKSEGELTKLKNDVVKEGRAVKEGVKKEGSAVKQKVKRIRGKL